MTSQPLTPSGTGSRGSGPGWFGRHPVLQVVLYYLLLLLLVQVIKGVLPQVYQVVAGTALPTGGDLSVFTGAPAGGQAAPSSTHGLPAGIVVFIAMVSTVLLMLPVLWVYAMTRQKKGYQQSMVQTLLILPIVVAAVVILVKNSVALAFSLGGIVGAIAFRNRLEDTKDAVYVFLAIVVGLACGVEVVAVAFSLSVFFNLLIVILWYTDFGRIPGEMSAPVAARRVGAVREAMAPEERKTGAFIDVLEQQVLQSMTPEQLQALMDRAGAQQQKMSGELYGEDDRFEGPVYVTATVTANPGELRSAVELVLSRDTKEWRFERTIMGPAGQPVMEWHIKCRRSMPPVLLAEAVRRGAIPNAQDVSIG